MKLTSFEFDGLRRLGAAASDTTILDLIPTGALDRAGGGFDPPVNLARDDTVSVAIDNAGTRENAVG